MKRIRGLIVAVLAIGTLAATPAIASAADGLFLVPGDPAVPPTNGTFEAEKYPASITGERAKNGSLVLIAAEDEETEEDWEVSCPSASFSGQLTSSTETLTLQPTFFSTCVIAGSLEATVAMNGCRYVYTNLDHDGEKEFHATAAIACDEGKAIEVKGSGCTVTLPAQALGVPAELFNPPTGSKDIFARTRGIGLQWSASGFFCSFIGVPPKTRWNGTSNLEKTLKGFYMVPGTPEISATEPTLEAAQYPSNVVGERLDASPYVGENVLMADDGWEATCEEVSLTGGKLTSPAETLTLHPTYSGGCMLGTLETTVAMNGCRYVYSGFEAAGSDYASPAAIACDSGKAIEAKGSGCKVTIPAQSLGAKANFANGKISGENLVVAEMAGSGLDYSASGFFCSFIGVSTGSHEDGTSLAHFLLRGKATS